MDVTTATTIASSNPAVVKYAAVSSSFFSNALVTRDNRWFASLYKLPDQKNASDSLLSVLSMTYRTEFENDSFVVPTQNVRTRQLVDVEINGRTYTALFDYGCTMSTMARSMWDEESIHETQIPSVYSTGEEFSTGIVSTDSIRIGNFVARDWQLAVVDDELLTVHYQWFVVPFRVDIVIGCDLLHRMDITFDY